MREIPPNVLNSFPSPHYGDPARRGPGLLIMNAIMSVVVGLVVLLRLYTRIFVQKWFGSDDVLIIISLIFTIAQTTVVLVAYREHRWDRHIWDIPSNKLQDTFTFAFVNKILFGIACTSIRASFLAFYQRLIKNTNNKWYRCTLLALWTYVLGLELISFLIEVFGCRPVRAYWTYPNIKNSTCLDEGLTNTTLGAFHCFADFLVTVWPIPIILNLQLPKKVRIYVITLLNIGFTVTIAGCLRTYYIWTSNASYDVTWNSNSVSFAAGIELHLGMICACAPALKALITKVAEPARAVFNHARSSAIWPMHHDTDTSEKSSEHGGGTVEIRGGGNTTPVTLDEDFNDMRNRASVNDILVRTTFRVENS